MELIDKNKYNEVKTLARELLDKNGFNDFEIKFVKTTSIIAQANISTKKGYLTKHIKISLCHVNNSRQFWIDVILHEIAHCLIYKEYGYNIARINYIPSHGYIFQNFAKMLGTPLINGSIVNFKSLYSDFTIINLKRYYYLYKCCDIEYKCYRKLKYIQVCKKCKKQVTALKIDNRLDKGI